MNYRHIYHAGNFADLVKHAVLTELLAAMTGKAPLTVIDTHAGAGLYDLAGDQARRTGEGAAVAALMADPAAPPVFDALKAAIRRLNEAGARYYPGSPALIAQALGPRDRLVACETRLDDFHSLREVLRQPGAQALREDGWDAAQARTPRAPAPALIHIDPPYEAADDSDRAAETVRHVLARNAQAVIAIWAPIKDLAGFDSFLTGVEEAKGGASALVAEVRLRPPDDPLRLNGCAVVTVNAPPGLAAGANAAAAWIVATLGDPGGLGAAHWL
jgi:23S rRNA (adenine2030-N6)-methyltransferase